MLGMFLEGDTVFGDIFYALYLKDRGTAGGWNEITIVI
jgi:hypothetical protein